MNWSHYQKDIFDYVEMENGGNAIVEAVAGSGKSTVLKECIYRIPESKSVLVLAFNRHIKIPLEQALEEQWNVKVQTMNGFGFAAVRRSLGRVKVNGDKTANVYRYDILNGADSEEDRAVFFSSVAAVKKIIALRKHLMMWDFSQQDMIALMDSYDIDQPSALTEGELLYNINAVWKESLKKQNIIDFDDQLVYPILGNYSLEQYDYILVDEAQDLSPVQIELTKRALKSSGRAIYCGDRKQAIYQFRGADSAAMQKIESDLDCTLLPLSICYRCGANIAAAAKHIVPQIEAAPDAAEGTVETIYSDEFNPVEEDMVLCRTTAPLVEGCLRLIRAGKTATVKGRDIGKSIETLIKKARCGRGVEINEFLSMMEEYYQKEHSKLASARREQALQTLEDKYDTILALSDHDDCRTVGDILDTIERLFSDEARGIMFSTVHKAKGLEASTVYILRPDLMPHPKSKDIDAELNICYVATTRAKLRLVTVLPEKKPVEPSCDKITEGVEASCE